MQSQPTQHPDALSSAVASGETPPNVADVADRELLDSLGKRRSPITLPEYRRGRKPANAGRKYPPEVLSNAEVARLLDAMGDGSSGVRDRALTIVLLRAGLRIAEALALEVKDVDLVASSISVLHGKGDKRRVVGVDPVAERFVARWLEVRAGLGVRPRGPLFCTITRDAGGPGRPMASSSYRDTLKRAATRAGIEKRIHPHGLRHTYAAQLALEGVPVPVIQKLLGHVDLAMTQHYIDHLAPTTVIDAMRAREWPTELLLVKPSTPAAVMSQGRAAPASTLAPLPSSVIAGDPPPPARAATHGIRAENGKALQRALDVIAANGGRATQLQITQTLGVTRGRTSQMMLGLQNLGLVIGAGIQRRPGQRGPGSRIWRLAPPKATFTLDEPHDPRQRAVLGARNGYGPARVLAVIEARDGCASQAQIARELGIGTSTVAEHCRELEREGKLIRGGLDKSTSNRGSQLWQLRGPSQSMSPAAWRTLRYSVPRASRTA